MAVAYVKDGGPLLQAALAGVLAPGGKAATLGQIPGAGHHALDGIQGVPFLVDAGDGLEQANGIGMPGVLEDGAHIRVFHLFPCVHHHHVPGDLGDNAQIVGDEDDGGLGLFLQARHELEDLGLDGHIQGGGGLVRDEDLGVAGQGHGDHHPLAHTAGELMGIVMDALLRVGDLYQPQHLNGPLPGLLLGHMLVIGKGLHDLLAHGEYRVQGGHRLLEDHADIVAPDGAHLLFRKGKEVFAVVEDLPVDDPARGIGDEPEDG